EEYPLALPFLSKEEDHYVFHGPVASFDGVGRFTLGLIDEVRIKSPDSFNTFLENKIMNQKL
ncbi:MAG: transcriptional regulator, partial [Bacteroidota bacterium]|nr:transcriptional regulator [Bacteroidota bacterium]